MQEMPRELETDSDGWEEREASRTHSVKFSEESTQEKDTPFVRQNTPHPKELKAKAHKLFAKDRTRVDDGNLDTVSEEISAKYAANATDKIGANSTIVENVAETKPIYENHQQQSLSPKTPTAAVSFAQQPAVVQTAGVQSQPDVSAATVHEPITNVAPEHGNSGVIVTTAAVTASAAGDDDDEDFDESERKVGFQVEGEDDDFYKRPMKLHRRDTPHHLKNKRVQHNVIDKKSSEILANALNQEKKTAQLPPVQSPIQENEDAEQIEQQEQQPFVASISPIPPPIVPGPLPDVVHLRPSKDRLGTSQRWFMELGNVHCGGHATTEMRLLYKSFLTRIGRIGAIADNEDQPHTMIEQPKCVSACTVNFGLNSCPLGRLT
ncbi:unnamed protein product [Ceratitis capitata]|uniref:(Mediterranean fruit fly) hypothetical protein n=1 Tax=Ceratitis capitata TaxID=7213 RepID=A0A811U7C2_CERCA|nr:unnamed protein product [Ceratitis capitata]